MTNETKQRIQYYQDALPHMKEKLIGAAMMLVIAISVTVTATYAWVTLSTAPEVTSVDTTVAANGSLEIALANGTGVAPGKSAVGDSTGAGTAVNAANITWGNLVNLSDPSYGLSKITLRPAALNGTSGLLTNPLYGVGYGEDGRVSSMVTDDDFAYVYYDSESGTNGAFLADLKGEHLGVRAISTVKYENLEGDNTLTELLQYTNQSLLQAKNNYANMTNETQEPGKSYIASLEGLIQIYAQNVIDRKSTSTLDITKYVPDLYAMMKYFNDSVMSSVGNSYVQMANMLELMKGSGNADAGYTVETLVAASKAGTLPDYIKNNMSSLSGYTADYYSLSTYLKDSVVGDFSDLTASEKTNSLAYWAYYASNGGTVYWSNLNNHINWICNINTATLDGYTLSSLSSMSTASKILGGENPHDAKINGGAIFRMEQRIGQKMSPTISVTVDATSIINLSSMKNVKLDAVLTTSAMDPYEMPSDRDAIKALNTGSFRGDTATAEDTYAMAIDLWVRTNAGSNGEATTETTTEELEDGTVKTTTVTTAAEQAYLTLEGAVVMGTKEMQTTVKDANGDEQPAYTATFTVDNQKVEMGVYERYGVYYFIDEESGLEIALEEKLKEEYSSVPDITYTPQMTLQDVVVGYEGVNRVWNEEQMAGFSGSGTNTTQGGGSCYVFYANTPADQSRFLELLGSMRVVFVNAQGRQIGFAYLDTENYFAETGKVTVPLVLDKTQAINLGTNIDGDTIYGLMPLIKNAATRVTALIYLDGTRLTNEMVLASGDIQGTLNIQFGSSSVLMRTTVITESKAEGDTTTETTDTTIDYVSGKDSVAIKDEEVMNQYVEIAARISDSSFDYDPENPAITTLSVTVDGVEPRNVTARFMRAISSTQGILQDPISLSESGSDWSAVCTFSRPGNYVLRSVWIDGVEYSLDSPLEVTVKGSTVVSLTCAAIPAGSNWATIMTANSYYSTEMSLGFSTSSAAPSRVNGIFMDENGRQVNVPFNQEDGEWKGTARFTTSGIFTMEYVEIDGDIYELNESLKPTLEILLGLKARTWIAASDETLAELQKLFPNALATNFVIAEPVTLQVFTELYDNSGNEITGLSNVKLYYGRAGSSVSSTGLDANLTWDAVSGRYMGSFNVKTAGTYRFNKVTIGTSNTVESYTEAPTIQAMPPEDAYYYNNYTETYQYAPAPSYNAKMTIGIAYSNAITKVEATLTNGITTQKVEGTIGLEAEDQGDESVNLWHFTVPVVNNESQEGQWQMTDVTMYGVYYDGRYYDSEGSGVTVDLTGENIKTKVVNYLNVTLNVGAEREFAGYFMDSHNVMDTSVTITDYEGQAVQGIEIGGVEVVYYLDPSTVSLETSGYEMTESATISVSGTGTLKNGSSTEYDVSTMNFQHIGTYKNCSVSVVIDGVVVIAGSSSSGTKIRYTENGKQIGDIPAYKVSWTSPTVLITGTDPAPSKTYNVNIGNMSGNAVARSSHNFISEDGLYVRLAASCGSIIAGYTSVTWPDLELTLSDAGSFSGAVLAMPNGSSKVDVSYVFSPTKMSVEETIGSSESGSRQQAGYQKISTITMSYGSVSYTANLSNPIVINEKESSIGTLEYVVSSAVENPPESVELPYVTNKVILPSVENYVELLTVDGEAGTSVTVSTEKENVYYRKGFGNYQKYELTSVTTKTPYTGASYNVTKEITGWIITRENLVDGTETTLNSGKAYSPGQEVSLAEGSYHYVATPVVEEVDRAYVGSSTQYHYLKTTTWSGPTQNFFEPSGTKFSDETKVLNYLNGKVGTEDLGWKDN